MRRTVQSLIATTQIANKRAISKILGLNLINFAFIKQIHLNQSFKKSSFTKCISFNVSSKKHQANKEKQSHSHNHHHSQADPITTMRAQLQKQLDTLQSQHPEQPQQVIKALYQKGQNFIGQNKKLKILVLFEIISDFIEKNNLVEQYSTFLIITASNSFLLGKYQDVEKKCKLAVEYEMKKHGEKHKNIADIYNILGIAISKNGLSRGQEGLNYLEKAFSIRKQIFGDSVQAAQVLFNMGIIQEDSQKMFEKAELNYLDSIEMHENSGIPNPMLYLKVKLRLAQVQLKLHQNYEKVISDYLRVEQLIEKYKTDKMFQHNQIATADMFTSLLHKNLGRAFAQTKQFAKAIKYFELCLFYLRQNKMQTQDRIKILQQCASSHAALQQYERALILLGEADKILANHSANQQYLYNFWKYYSQVYSNAKKFDQQQNLILKIKNLLKTSKQSFANPLSIIENQMRYIYSLGNSQRFDILIEHGLQFVQLIQKHKNSFLKASDYLDYKSNALSYLGLAYSSQPSEPSQGKALEYLSNAELTFDKLPMQGNRVRFYSNVLRSLSRIYISSKKYQQGFKFLQKYQKILLNKSDGSSLFKLNTLVQILVDHGVSSSTQNIYKLIEADYVNRINILMHKIWEQMCIISSQPRCKQILGNYMILNSSLYNVMEELKKMKKYDKKEQDLSKGLQIVEKIVNLYCKVYEKEIKEIKELAFKEDQIFGKLLEQLLNVKNKIQLSKKIQTISK